MVTLRARGKGDAEPSSAPPRRQMPKRSSESPQRAPPMTRRRVAELREEDRLKAKDDERNHVDSEPSADQDQGPAGSAIRKSQNVQKPAGDGGGLRRSTRTMAPIYRYQILSSFNPESTPETVDSVETKRDDEDETLEQEEEVQEEEEEEEQEEEEQQEEEQEEEEQQEEEQQEEEQQEEEQQEEEQQEEEDGGVEEDAGCNGAKPPSLHRGPSSEFQRRTFRIGASGPFPTRRVAFRHTKDDNSDSDSDDVVRNVGKVPKRPRNLNPDKTLADIDPSAADQSVGFDSIGGLSDHISALKEMVVFPLLYPEVFDNFKIQPPRGCLFYGPPGTGKTLLARALANECGQFTRKVSFFMRKGADCLRKWVGESEQQLQMLFEQAYQKRPSIIFFDEIDGLAPERSSRQDLIHSSIVSTLLALMDGMDSRGEVVVIGATNRLDSIDPALRRPGRFDREFLFGLPDRESRKEILKIHTRPWKPRPSDEFLDELAGKCVGYCGADIRGVCTEAALCALRRRYPQIYGASQKLLLDCSSIVVGPCDFAAAMRKTLPASHRSAPVAAKPLSPVVQPLLGAALRRALEALQRLFPHGEQGMKRKRAPDRTSGIPDNVLMDGEDAATSSISTSCPNSSSFLLFTSSAAKHPTSHRPRMLLAGCPASGQTSHLGPALLHALERFTVHNLDSAVLFSVSGTSPEEACAQVFRAARRTPPSVLYMPHIQQWWGTAGCSLRASFLSLLGSVPSLSPILLLATCSVPHEQLDPEIQSLFREEYGEVFAVSVPTLRERGDFFQDLILNQAAEAPPSKRRALTQAVEVLSLAPLSPPRQLPERERLRQEEQEEDVLRKLRLYLRHVTERLTMDRRFKAFGKPVDIEEVPDYLLVVQRPMDFSTLMTNIDKQKYATVAEFLSDVDLIWRNALQYNSDSDHMDRHIRHRACALKDTVHNIIRSELYEGFEHECEEIRAARVSRASSCITETRPEEADCPGPPRGDNKRRRAGANMAAAPQQKQTLSEETPPLVVDRATLRNVLSRAVKKTEGCEVAPLEKLHALLAQSVYRHRNNHDKTQLVQEMEKEIDSFSASHTSGLFK